MQRKKVKKQKKVVVPTCIHDYIKIDGITICSKCDFKAISYLMPLKTTQVFYL